ncbi:MAG: NAD-dependent epimerase/dehydratase family protein [Bryobacteraceae bacterium]|jgi:nucleoside-diphosphate-sugar epimerase
MTALVTGASGFLGGRLVQMLAADGVRVRILARRGAGLRHLAGLPVDVVEGRLADAEALAAAVRGITHIYHCAGCSTDWAPEATFFAANVEGVRNLLAAAAGSGSLRRLLHVSTTDVYGYPCAPCDESHPTADVGLPYNRTKRLGEECVWEARRNTGLPVTVVRPATIFGPRGQAFTADIARHIRQGWMAVIDGGRAPGGFCYVDNAVRAMIQAANTPQAEGRAYNIADGSGKTWREYVDALADALGKRRPVLDIPSVVALPLARLLEACHRTLRLPGRPLLTRHAVYLLSRNQEYPAERARRELGFAPEIGFAEGVARAVEWLQREWAGS